MSAVGPVRVRARSPADAQLRAGRARRGLTLLCMDTTYWRRCCKDLVRDEVIPAVCAHVLRWALTLLLG